MPHKTLLSESARKKLVVLRDVFLRGKRQNTLVRDGYGKSSVHLHKKEIEGYLRELRPLLQPEWLPDFVSALEELLADLLDD